AASASGRGSIRTPGRHPPRGFTLRALAAVARAGYSFPSISAAEAPQISRAGAVSGQRPGPPGSASPAPAGRRRRSRWLRSFAALLLPILAPAQDAAGDEKTLLTVAEATGFRRTASHAEVVALVDQLDASSERIARVDLGSSNEGRAIPALIIA